LHLTLTLLWCIIGVCAGDLSAFGVYEPGSDCFDIDCENGGWCIDGVEEDKVYTCLCTNAFQPDAIFGKCTAARVVVKVEPEVVVLNEASEVLSIASTPEKSSQGASVALGVIIGLLVRPSVWFGGCAWVGFGVCGTLMHSLIVRRVLKEGTRVSWGVATSHSFFLTSPPFLLCWTIFQAVVIIYLVVTMPGKNTGGADPEVAMLRAKGAHDVADVAEGKFEPFEYSNNPLRQGQGNPRATETNDDYLDIRGAASP
jgi:hypothetical protein